MTLDTLAFDLDGTLLGRDERISPRNLRAVKRASDAGFRVVLATARWYRLAVDAAEQLRAVGVSMDGPAVACSGAQVRRLADGVDVFDRRLPAAFLDELATRVDGVRCIAWAALDETVLAKMDGPARTDLPPTLVQTASLRDALGAAIARMVLVQGTDACALIESELGPTWSDRVRFVESFSSSSKRILTLTAQGADKGAALQAACAELSTDPSRVVAFGDAENDLDMFGLAGASVAMGQASDSVKAAANAVSTSGYDDGVAVAIEALLDRGPDALARGTTLTH